MKCRIAVFGITILCFATITVAQPQIPTSNPAGGVLNVRGILDSNTDGGPAKGPSEREFLCSDLVSFAFSESRNSLAQSQDSSIQNARLLWARGYSTTSQTSPPVETFIPTADGYRVTGPEGVVIEPRRNQSRGLARLDRTARNQTIQEQIVVLYNICKSTDNSIEVEH